MTSKVCLSFLIFLLYQIVIARGDNTRCPIKFADIPAHRNFDGKEFQGTWYTQFQTLYVKDAWDSQTITFEINNDGLVDAKYSGFRWETKQCHNVNRMGMRSPTPGYYISQGPNDVVHMKVVFTDYENAVIFTCNTNLSSNDCPKHQSQIDIITRDQYLPPLGVLRRLKHHMADITCVNAVDLDETSQGLCDPDVKIRNVNMTTEPNIVPARPIPTGTVATTTTIGITWSVPRDHYVSIDNYTISYGHNILTLDHSVVVEGDTNYVSLSNLDPDTQYLIEIRGRNDIGDGTAVYLKRKTKPREEKNTYDEKVLTSAPIQLNVVPHVDNPVNALLSWEHPEQAVGSISNYRIEYCKLNCVHKTRLNVTGHQKSTDIMNLSYDTVYQFFVKACTAFGCGAITSTTYRSPDRCETHEHALPTTFTRSDLIGTWHTISRTKNVQKDAEPEAAHYQFSVDVNGTLTAVYSALFGGVCKTKDARELTELSHGIYELDIGTKNKLKGTLVMAYIDDKFAVVEACLSQFLNDKSCQQTKHVEIWSKDKNQISIPVANNLERFISENLCTPVTDLYPIGADVCPISEETKTIDVDNKNTVPSSDNTAVVEVSAMEIKVFTSAPRDLTAAIANGDSTKVLITWTNPLHAVGPVTGYKIWYCTLLCDKRKTYKVGGNITSLSIAGLLYNTVYQISVKACTLFDCGPVSSITYWTPEKCVPVGIDSKLTQGSRTLFRNYSYGNQLCPFIGRPDPLFIRSRLHSETAESKEEKVIGIWHTVSTTTYIWKENTWTSDIRNFVRNDDGTLSLVFTAKSGDTCNPVVSYSLTASTTGSLVSEGVVKVHTTFVYNDDKYAIVDMCFEDLVSGRCDISKRQVQIWSRQPEDLPLEMEQKLQDIISKKMCIPLIDLIDAYPGQCTLPNDNQLTAVEPALKDKQGGCLPEQELHITNFRGENFVGQWFTLSRTAYASKSLAWESAVQKFVLGEHGDYKVFYTAEVSKTCLPVMVFNLTFVKPGEYQFDFVLDESFTGYTKIIYTDYTYAVVDICNAALVNNKCDHSRRQVEIWSTRKNITLEMKKKLGKIIKEKLCIPLTDLIDTSPGKCIVKDVVPSPKEKANGATLSGKCSSIVDDLPVQNPLDMNMLIGSWDIIETTEKNIISGSITFVKKSEESLISNVRLNRKTDGHCKEENETTVIRRKCNLNDGNFFVTNKFMNMYHQWLTYKVMFAENNIAVIYKCSKEDIHGACAVDGTTVHIISKMQKVSDSDLRKIYKLLTEACIDPSSLSKLGDQCQTLDKSSNLKAAGIPLQSSQSMTCVVSQMSSVEISDISKITGLWYAAYIPLDAMDHWESGVMSFTKQGSKDILLKYAGSRNGTHCVGPYEMDIIEVCPCCSGINYVCRFRSPMLWSFSPWKILYLDDAVMVNYACLDIEVDGTCSTKGQKLHILAKNGVLPPSVRDRIFSTVVKSACVDSTRLKNIENGVDCSKRLL